MNDFEKAKYEQELLKKHSKGYNLLAGRIGLTAQPSFRPGSVQGVNDLAQILTNKGGLTQQQRMIRDKRRTLDKAVLYSYQGAFVKKYYPDDMELMEGVREQPPVRALINPNKVKQDYDEKIISIGYEHEFHTGDIFEWVGTGTHWLIYLQELTELAYFRANIRKCTYEIKWMDENHKTQSVHAAVRGPVETRIDYLQKYGNSYDNPNYSLEVLIPKNQNTLKYFVRYARFYLSDGLHNVCWRIEGVDAFSMPNIIQFTAVEYYGNKDTDIISDGIANGTELNIESTPLAQGKLMAVTPAAISGETTIKPKREYIYTVADDIAGNWEIDKKYPLEYTTYVDNKGMHAIKLKWNNNYSGQFDLIFNAENDLTYNKTIIVESLF